MIKNVKYGLAGVIILLIGMIFSACAGAANAADCQGVDQNTPLHVTQAWVRAADRPKTDEASGATGAFMVIHNCGKKDFDLIKASSTAAMMVELHKGEMRDGMTMMSPTEKITLPAGQKVELKAGEGVHIMLMKLTKDIKVGDKIDMTLEMRSGENLKIMLDAKSQ